MSATPFKLAIAALGGQGGAVLTGWLVEIAEANAYLVQTTSVPGVAQRTGATLYYLEFFARKSVTADGREPVMALMPVAGDVDCVVAAELVEAGRSMARGLVTPERTTLIASSHREFTIGERSAMGHAAATEDELVEIARAQARKFILFDMAAMAAKHESVISAVLLGAIAGSAVLPFHKEAFEAAIRAGGLAVRPISPLSKMPTIRRRRERLASPHRWHPKNSRLISPPGAHARATGPARTRQRQLPPAVQPPGARRRAPPDRLPGSGIRPIISTKIERVAQLAMPHSAATGDASLTAASARSLALWMSFEDTIRVADLKTRAARSARGAQRSTRRAGTAHRCHGVHEATRRRNFGDAARRLR